MVKRNLIRVLGAAVAVAVPVAASAAGSPPDGAHRGLPQGSEPVALNSADFTRRSTTPTGR